MKFSIWLPSGVLHDFSGYADPVKAYEALTELAHAADESSYDTVWTADHFEPYPAGPGYVFESWTTLAAFTRDTNRARIAQMVTGNGYRNPAIHAKMASTLDVLSQGRFRFGIGAGNYEDEYHDYGYEFPDGGQWLHELREALQIILSMWTKSKTTFQRDFYQRDALNDPKGVQQPYVPLLIGAGGERGALRLVAEYGDACNVVASPSELARQGQHPQGLLCAGRPRLQLDHFYVHVVPHYRQQRRSSTGGNTSLGSRRFPRRHRLIPADRYAGHDSRPHRSLCRRRRTSSSCVSTSPSRPILSAGSRVIFAVTTPEFEVPVPS